MEKWERETDAAFAERQKAMWSCPDDTLALWEEEEMLDKRIAVPLSVVLFAGNAVAGGLLLCAENDAFSGSDDYYTHGMEVLRFRDVRMQQYRRIREWSIHAYFLLV